jgi:methylamine---glutamate N-methyltransferase subunit B
MSAEGATLGDLIAADLASESVRELNQRLHDALEPARVSIRNPGGKHAIAAGLNVAHDVEIDGHVGYYCAGMNQLASVRVHGNCGVGVAENMMSGTVTVAGSASQSAAASAHGGLLVIDGDASARCAISLKGADVVVRGSVGHMSAFMAQRGTLVVFGDAGEALGDSLYEAHLYVRGSVTSLGADCIEKEVRDEHLDELAALLTRAHADDVEPREFRRYGSARRLYNFHVENLGSY